MKNIGLFFLLMVMTSETVQAQSDRNFVGGELLGRALGYSADYERSVIPRVALGVGFAGYHIGNENIFIVPLYLSVTPIGHAHQLYLAAGATLGVSNTTLFTSRRDLFRRGVWLRDGWVSVSIEGRLYPPPYGESPDCGSLQHPLAGVYDRTHSSATRTNRYSLDEHDFSVLP